MRIRSKLLLLLTVPLLAVSIAAAAGFRAQSSASEEAERALEVSERSRAAHRMAAALMIEQLSTLGADVDPDEVAVATDESIAELRRFAMQHGDDEIPEVADEIERLVVAARAATDPTEATHTFDEAVEIATEIDHHGSDALSSNEEVTQFLVTRMVSHGIHEQIEAWLTYLEFDAESDMTRNLATATTRFTTSHQYFVTAGELSAGEDQVLTATMTELARLETVALDDLAEGQASLGADDVIPTLTTATLRWNEVIDARDQALVDLVQSDLDDAEGLRSLFSLLALVGAIVLGGMVFVIYRSITHPLNDLLVRADAVANTELPLLVQTLRHTDDVSELPAATPIPSTSSDEIGELIHAFNDVQLTAYDLATEQAIGRRNVSEMFVNLGRRNQQLLQRMLSKLTDLERDEEDPDTLEDLFALDNIVTRMRRNAESLLVLAGSQTPRQWSAPVPVDDAVRAAFGEVEGYERIDIAALSEADIRGNVVADVAHLLAELLENSLNFSAATTKVLVSGQHERSGYLITIFDQGIGMDPDELDEANRRISDPPPLDQVPTKFLGLFVVGRLADRHGITVRLLEAPGRGIMARVQLPGSLLAGEHGPAVAEPTIDDLGELTEDDLAMLEAPGVEVDEPVFTEPETIDTHGEFDEVTQAEVLAAGLDQVPPVFATSRPITDIEPDALPTRPVAQPTTSDELPTRTRGASAAGDELPTRTRGATALAEGDDEHPLRRKTDGTTPRAADASEFSSMMSAFSSGVSRGMEESRFEAELDGPSTFHTDNAAEGDPASENDERSQP